MARPMISRTLSVLLAVTGLAVLAPAASAETVDVSAKSNIFGAGHAAPPAGFETGDLPPTVGFAAGTGRKLTFTSVTGMVGCCGGSPGAGPDGESAGSSIGPAGGISQIIDDNRRMFLVGVFLTDTEPADPAPAGLNFSDSAIGHDFTTLSPAIAQTFYIGDGKTGAGVTQEFVVPAGATRLALGFADANGFVGSPSNYGDNVGSLSATFDLGTGGSGGGNGGGNSTPPPAGNTLPTLSIFDDALASIFGPTGRFTLPGGGNNAVRLLTGGQGIAVTTLGSCRLTVAERAFGVRASARGKAKKRKLGYLKKTSIVARGAGRWVVPLTLTKKGKKALAPKRKRARGSAGAAAAVRDPINVTCAPVQFPPVVLGGNTVTNPTAKPQPVPGGIPTTTPAKPPITAPPPAAPQFKSYSAKSELGSSDSISFESDGKTIRGFTGSILMSCASTGAGGGPLADGRPFAIKDLKLPVANGGFSYTRTLPDYLTISGSIDATQAYFAVVVGQGFPGYGTASVVQCGARQQFRAKAQG